MGKLYTPTGVKVVRGLRLVSTFDTGARRAKVASRDGTAPHRQGERHTGKEMLMQEQQTSGKTVTERIEIKITIKKTIAETESNKKTACSCYPKCKR